MTPNLFLATQTLFSPHKWFKSSKQARPARPVRTTEHWDSPVPGFYEYIPGRGWYLIATDKDPSAPVTTTAPLDTKSPTTATIHAAPASDHEKAAETETSSVKLAQPIPVKYSKVLKKHLLAPDYISRKRHGRIKDESNGRVSEAGFFRLDDGVAWVHCWDQHGEFIPGPYQLWFWDGDADGRVGRFRHMRKGDDPEYVHSQANSRAGSRENSTHRKSMDSRSTRFRIQGGTVEGGSGTQSRVQSQPSTRPGSLRMTSAEGSGQNSPKGGKGPAMDRTLSEATTLLNPIAAEQAAAGRGRGTDMDKARGRGVTGKGKENAAPNGASV